MQCCPWHCTVLVSLLSCSLQWVLCIAGRIIFQQYKHYHITAPPPLKTSKGFSYSDCIRLSFANPLEPSPTLSHHHNLTTVIFLDNENAKNVLISGILHRLIPSDNYMTGYSSFRNQQNVSSYILICLFNIYLLPAPLSKNMS